MLESVEEYDQMMSVICVRLAEVESKLESARPPFPFHKENEGKTVEVKQTEFRQGLWMLKDLRLAIADRSVGEPVE